MRARRARRARRAALGEDGGEMKARNRRNGALSLCLKKNQEHIRETYHIYVKTIKHQKYK